MLLESAFEAKVEFTIARGAAGCPIRQRSEDRSRLVALGGPGRDRTPCASGQRTPHMTMESSLQKAQIVCRLRTVLRRQTLHPGSTSWTPAKSFSSPDEAILKRESSIAL